jgi:hypothetical protein
MRRTLWIGGVLYGLASLFFYFGSPILVQLWVGPGQYIGRTVLAVFAVNLLIAGLAVLPTHFVLASGANPFPFMTLLQGVLTIAGVVILCPLMGIMGVPLSSLAAGLLTSYWYNPLKGWQTWQSLHSGPVLQRDVTS